MPNENETNENDEVNENQTTPLEPSEDEALGAEVVEETTTALAVVGVGIDAAMKLTALATKWRDTGSRYRTECARQMLAVLGGELPELPPAGDELLDSHAKIPVGGLIADLDDRLRRQREEITILARRLGSHLLTLADSIVSSPNSQVNALGMVGDQGARLDRACASYNATKELRVWLGRVAYQHRAAARRAGE
jgi:hypothetical protein